MFDECGLHQPGRLKLAAQGVRRILQRGVVDGVDRQQRLHRADGGVDLPARVIGDVRRGADQLIRGERQVVRVVVELFQLRGRLRGRVGIVQLADVVLDVRLALQRRELAQVFADRAAVAADAL